MGLRGAGFEIGSWSSAIPRPFSNFCRRILTYHGRILVIRFLLRSCRAYVFVPYAGRFWLPLGSYLTGP